MTDVPAPPEGLPGVGVDRLRADEALYHGFNPGPVEFQRGEDGLPTPRTPTKLPLVPPLVPETFVCMEDASQFVIRDEWGEITEFFLPEEVRRAADGRYYVFAWYREQRKYPDIAKVKIENRGNLGFYAEVPGRDEGYYVWVEGERVLGEEEIEVHRDEDGAPFITAEEFFVLTEGKGRVQVHPLRPQCKFLARQMVDMQDSPDNQMVERLCTARRDSESFFLSVGNSQVHACELRSPRDASSEERLARFDAAKVKQGRERYKKGGEFDVDEALKRTEAEADRGLRYGGIFKEE